MAGPIRASITADAREFSRAVDKVEAGADDMAQAARQAGQRMETAFDNVGSAADGTASATSQAAGGIGDIAGALEATGLISESTAQSMAVMEASIMGATGVADIANLAFEKLKLGMIATRIQTIATSAATKVWTGIQAAFNAVMAINPIFLVILAIVALVAIIIIAYKKSETFRAIVDAVFAALVKAAQWVWDKVAPFFEWLGGIFQKVWEGISAIWSGTLGPWFKGLGKKITGGIGNLGPALLQKGKDLLAGLKRGAVWVWDHSVIGWLWNRKDAIARAIGNVGSTLLQKGKDLLAGLKRGAVSVWENSVVGWLWNRKDAIGRAIGNLGSTLYGAGKDLLRGLRDGIQYAWDAYVAPLLSKVTDMIPDWKGPIERDRELLAPAGTAIMQGLADSMDAGFHSSVRRSLSRATDAIGATSFDVSTSSAAGGGGVTVHVTVQGIVGDPVATGKAIAGVLGAYVGAGGRVVVA